MEILSKIKLIAECIAAVDTAFITLLGLFHLIKPTKRIVNQIIRPFFLGVKSTSGKKVFCFAAIKEQKEQQKQFNDIKDVPVRVRCRCQDRLSESRAGKS